MTAPADPIHRAGWEAIWRSDHIPKRFQSFAAPEGNVVAWSDSLPAGASILDVGCGVGRHCVYLGKRDFQVSGVDISPSGIDMARKACAERGIAFEGHVSDMTALPWPDATFDAALSISTIHHHLRADIARAIGEVWRVLKPGGVFLVDFPCTDTLDYQRLSALAASGHIMQPEPNTFIDERPDSDDMDGYLPHHFCDEADIRDLLGAFEMIKLWAALHPAKPERGNGMVGKWVAWARKPSTLKD